MKVPLKEILTEGNFYNTTGIGKIASNLGINSKGATTGANSTRSFEKGIAKNNDNNTHGVDHDKSLVGPDGESGWESASTFSS